MTKEEQFVNELIGYIFAYPDDDYMTMECLCRKLFKYGLIEKKDGEWTTDFIDRKTEPTISKMEQVDEPQTDKDFKVTYTCSFTDCDNFKNFGFGEKCIECKRKQSEAKHKDEPQICDTCRYYNSNIPCGSTPSACKEADKFAEEFVEGLKKLKPTGSKMEQVETMSCQECKHWDCLINADWKCALKECNYEPKDEPQTYITEDRDTQILDAWQVHHRSTTSVEERSK